MLKIRLEGLPEEVEAATLKLHEVYDVLSISKPYPNRNSKMIRIYVDMELKKD